MTESIYAPILDVLADHQPKSLGQLEQAVKDKGVVFAQLTQAVMLLTGAGHLSLVQDEATISKARQHCKKLNAYLCHKARGSNDVSYLASPVTGGGVAVNRFQQLFLLSIAQGKKQPAEWVAQAWALIAAQGQKLVKEGKTLDTTEENLAELTAQATAFAEKQLPILKALQVA